MPRKPKSPFPSPAAATRRVDDQEAGPQLDGDCPGRRPGVHHALQEGRAGGGAAAGRVSSECPGAQDGTGALDSVDANQSVARAIAVMAWIPMGYS